MSLQLPEETAIERALGPTEDMYWRFDAVSPLNFGSIVRFEGPLEMPAFRKALDAIQLRHPLLRVAIRPEDDGTPWYRSGTPPIPLRYLYRPQGDEWQILENELNTKFDSTIGPLIRCTLIQHDDTHASLVSVYHHAICDGKSSVFLIRDMLQSLAQQRHGQSAELEPLPLLEYYGNRIPGIDHYDDLDSLVRTAWKTLQASTHFLSHIGIPMGIRKKQHAVPLSEQKILVEPRFVEPEQMKAIARRAKQEQTSVQCVLNAALSLTVAADSPTRKHQATSSTQVLDIRHRLVPPVGEDCGCFASGATSLHHLTPDTPFWPLTREIKASLQESLETPLPFFHPALHKSFARLGKTLGKDHADIFSNIISKLHPEGLAVSNLGQVVIEVPDSPLTVTDYAFATNTNVLNYFNTSAATFNGRMTWSFSGSSVLGREKVAEIADKTVARMLQALEE